MQDGNRIAELRTSKNLSQQDIANLLGTSLSTYKRYEENECAIMIEQLNVLSNLFNVSLDYLLGLTENPVCKRISSEIDYKYLRFSIRYHRRIRRIKQTVLAKEFNITVQTIHNYEKYANNVTVNFLIQFANKFHISVDYICGKTLKKEIL